MSMLEQIEFRKQRDFGDVINVTFQFLRQNFSLLSKSLLFIVGPVALLGGLSGVGYIDSLPTVLDDSEAVPDALSMGLFGLYYMLLIVMGLLASVLAVTVVSSFMFLYQARGAGGFDFEDVWAKVKERLWDMAKTTMLAVVLYMSSFVFMLAPMMIIALSTSSGAMMLAAVATFIGIIICIAIFFYFVVVIALLYPVRMFESSSTGVTFSRSRFLLKDNYLNSFAVLIVSAILMMILGMVFSAPNYAFAFVGGLHSLTDGEAGVVKYPLMLLSVLGSIGSSLMYAVPVTAMNLQYFSLVEKKEQTGLMGRIDALDKQAGDGV
ncbi:MAG: hypothetical protein AAF564_01265 [Bacteroidota bacterium]